MSARGRQREHYALIRIGASEQVADGQSGNDKTGDRNDGTVADRRPKGVATGGQMGAEKPALTRRSSIKSSA